jgi:hypothetical protein
MASQNSSLQTTKQWGIMAAILFILPKCPLCILALLSMGSGVSLTAAQATSLQGYLLIVFLTIFILAVQKIYNSQNRLQATQNIVLTRLPVVLITALVSIFIFGSFFTELPLQFDYQDGRIVYSCPIFR